MKRAGSASASEGAKGQEPRGRRTPSGSDAREGCPERRDLRWVSRDSFEGKAEWEDSWTGEQHNQRWTKLLGLFRKQLQLGRTLGNINLKKSEGHLGDYLQRTLNIKMKYV